MSSPTAWQLISDIVFTIGLLVMCLFKGAATNRLTADHTALLNARVLEVEDAIANVRARFGTSMFSSSRARTRP